MIFPPSILEYGSIPWICSDPRGEAEEVPEESQTKTGLSYFFFLSPFIHIMVLFLIPGHLDRLNRNIFILVSLAFPSTLQAQTSHGTVRDCLRTGPEPSCTTGPPPPRGCWVNNYFYDNQLLNIAVYIMREQIGLLLLHGHL